MPVAQRFVRPGSPIPPTVFARFLRNNESLADGELLGVLDALFIGFENPLPPR